MSIDVLSLIFFKVHIPSYHRKQIRNPTLKDLKFKLYFFLIHNFNYFFEQLSWQELEIKEKLQ